MPDTWNYLVVTASNEQQGCAYREQLARREQLGLLGDVGEVLVVPDPGGRRVGSGGSTLQCLTEILQNRLDPGELSNRDAWEAELSALRILIVHGGGDSRRLPAYSPCGKIFVPVPGDSDSALATTLFDRQLPTYLALASNAPGRGQIVIASGDVLLTFDPSNVALAGEGMVGLAVAASPKSASRHGVYCPTQDSRVRTYLQKPSVEDQQRLGAVDRYGQSLLDIGVISFDASTAAALLSAADVQPSQDGHLTWSGSVGEAIDAVGLDFYREICCAMGTETSLTDYLRAACDGGSGCDQTVLERLYETLSSIAFGVRVLPQCGFMHFGTTRQVITSGSQLVRLDLGAAELKTPLLLCSEITGAGQLAGANSWAEGCRIAAPLELGGGNVIVGLDVDAPTSLEPCACIDVLQGADRSGHTVWFVRCSGVDDTFKESWGAGAVFCGRSLEHWLQQVGLTPAQVWDDSVPTEQQTLWNARLFPATANCCAWRDWLWMFRPESASPAQKRSLADADRYASCEIALLADQEAFHRRRTEIHSEEITASVHRLFRKSSGFSARDLTFAIEHSRSPEATVAAVVSEAARQHTTNRHRADAEGFVFSRIIHTLADALFQSAGDNWQQLLAVTEELAEWLGTVGLAPADHATLDSWAARARGLAFEHLEQTILTSTTPADDPPTNALRSDEIVWGRAPARIDLGGGWTDTPPQALEHGGCVLNAAVDLNGQPPIHAYARVIDEPVIRITSIDQGSRVEIHTLEELLDFRVATGEFSLAKAALAVSGFSPEAARWPDGTSLEQMLTALGGGIELSTLAAIPKGSGLGTSSIVGAVLLAVIHRVMGRQLSRRDLFHGVLRLEQALTTGGGWQDQIGGAVDGVKIITASSGLVPDPTIAYVPGDVLRPHSRGGTTLLYYTGITRLARNILQEVVGSYLSRSRRCVQTLQQLRRVATEVTDAMSRKDLPAFGRLISRVWRLNVQLDPHATNEQVDQLLARIAPHVYGAKLLGAGGGGFMLMVCKSPEDAAVVTQMLDSDPPNERARFFDFQLSTDGLVVTVC